MNRILVDNSKYKYLLQPTEEYTDFDNKEVTSFIVKELIETLKASKGMGLARNQCGLDYSIFVMVPDLVIFNPKILEYSKETEIMPEGCLSFPGLIFNIARPKEVEIMYQDINGKFINKRFSGLTARIVQHETLHLQGKIFFENVSRIKIEMAVKTANKNGHKFSFSEIYKLSQSKVVETV